jgi:hypothetical protein
MAAQLEFDNRQSEWQAIAPLDKQFAATLTSAQSAAFDRMHLADCAYRQVRDAAQERYPSLLVQGLPAPLRRALFLRRRLRRS